MMQYSFVPTDYRNQHKKKRKKKGRREIMFFRLLLHTHVDQHVTPIRWKAGYNLNVCFGSILICRCLNNYFQIRNDSILEGLKPGNFKSTFSLGSSKNRRSSFKLECF